jgi:hypothetical protein
VVEGHEALEKRQAAPKPGGGSKACRVITVADRGERNDLGAILATLVPGHVPMQSQPVTPQQTKPKMGSSPEELFVSWECVPVPGGTASTCLKQQCRVSDFMSK